MSLYSAPTSTATSDTPVIDCDSSLITSGISWIFDSSLSVISSSTLSGAAPGKYADTSAVRMMNSGSSRRGTVRYAIAPKAITSAKNVNEVRLFRMHQPARFMASLLAKSAVFSSRLPAA